MKLNVGCGDDVRDGMINVDLRPTGQVVADVACLPFRDRCADILALDILEHFPVMRVGKVLDEWRRVGTSLEVRVPNIEALSRTIVARPASCDMLIRNLYGGHRWGVDGCLDAHHWGWTPATLERDLEIHGFGVESNDHALNMTVVAR